MADADPRVRIWPKTPGGGAYPTAGATARPNMARRPRFIIALCDVTFLRRHDGLVFNGHVIYAATENKKRYTMGFIEVNEGFGQGDDRFVFYGEDDITLYAQDQISRAWVALDRPSLDVVDAFPSFDAMLAKILRQSLQWLTP